MAAASAHAIGVGSVLSVQDSIAPDGMAWRWMVFRPERWLKGRESLALLRIYFPQISNFGHRQVFEWMHSPPVRCLVFVRSVADARAPYRALAEHPHFPGVGILRMTDDDSEVEIAATQAIKRITPEELARRSTLVIVGEAHPARGLARAYARQFRYSEVQVDSVLVGSAAAGLLRVYGPYGQIAATGTVLLMLRSGEEGAYEVVTAGAFAISNGVVKRLDESIASVAARIRGATSSR